MKQELDISISGTKNIDGPLYLAGYYGHTVYVIETRGKDFGDKEVHQVERRFSDFFSLRQGLMQNEDYKKIYWPVLPDKKYFGRHFGAEFIQNRRVRLEAFLQNLITLDDNLKSDGLVQAFLTFDSDEWAMIHSPNAFRERMESVYD